MFPPKYAVDRDQGCRGYDLVNASSALYHRLNPSATRPPNTKRLASGGYLTPIGDIVANIPSAQLYSRYDSRE